MVTFSGTVQSDFLKFLPQPLDNKQKLIDFAASDFEGLRDNLIKYVRSTFPLDYNNFQSSDFGVLMLELMAAIGHIQSNKSDYLVNENFIGTARSRDSVKRLLELIGVRMKGPISAAANATITYTPDAVTNPTTATIEAANRVINITSPEDGGTLTYTLYKVNSNGTVDITNTSTDLVFNVSASNGTVTITDAVLLEGALVVETGTFTTPEEVKTINLSEFPYVEKSAQIFLEGDVATQGVYKEEDNIYFASGATDKIFQVTTDKDFKASILFGDDSIGTSPSFGDNYTVTYRVGGGSRGNIAEGVINSRISITSQDSVLSETIADASVENSSLATGGRDAESVAQAKRYAPLIFRSQNRLVTLSDFKSFANSFASNYGSTGKATAVVRRAFSSANIIDLFVLERASDNQLRRATKEYKRQLLEAIEDKKMLTDEVVVVDGLIRTLDLYVTITLDNRSRRDEPAIIQQARTSVEGYMNIDNTDFSEPFVPQDLVRVLLEDVGSVRYATVDNVDSTINVGFNEITQLNNLIIKTQYV
jgi:predicted phage baseplate assembly protein